MPTDLTAEIVTFRAAPGIDDATLARHADAVRDWLARQPGFVARTLSCNDDGLWTDHLIWKRLEDAQAAGRKFPSEPAASAFMAAIDMARTSMNHSPIVLRQTGQPTGA